MPITGNSEYYLQIETSCQILIRRDERFEKTSVGWILRDISNHDPGFVELIVTENIHHLCAESLKNATKQLSQQERDYFRQMAREMSNQNCDRVLHSMDASIYQNLISISHLPWFIILLSCPCTRR